MLGLTLGVILAWSTPATRTDGSALDVREISYYVIIRNGEEWGQTTATTYSVDRSGEYTVRCVDSAGITSSPSNSLRVKVKGRRKK